MGGGALIIGSFTGSLSEWPTIHLGGWGWGRKGPVKRTCHVAKTGGTFKNGNRN